MKQDIKDISEKELTKLYSEYQAGLGRPVPAVVHRQGRHIPDCVSAHFGMESGYPASIGRCAIEVEVADHIVAVAPVELLISFK